jgi:hypothetical protein
MIKHELLLKQSFAKWMRLQHPDIHFETEALSEVGLKPYQAKMLSELSSKGVSFPDTKIYYPSGDYHGLFIEFKKESPFYKETKIIEAYTQLKPQWVMDKKGNRKYNHIERQDEAMKKLNQLGYFCCFCWSIDSAMRIVNGYIKSNIFFKPHTSRFYSEVNK